MTTPSQPGPTDPNNPYQQQPGQPGGPNWGTTPAQGFSQQQPYGQPDGGQGSYQGFGGEPPKKKTGLIVGLAILAVIVIGGIIALILVLTNKDDDKPPAAANTPSATSGAPATSSAPSKSTGAPSTSNTPTGGSSGKAAAAGQASPQALADYVARGYENADGDAVFRAVCPSAGGSTFLIPQNLTASIEGPVTDTGFTMLVKSTTGQESKNFTAKIRQEGGSWCISDLR